MNGVYNWLSLMSQVGIAPRFTSTLAMAIYHKALEEDQDIIHFTLKLKSLRKKDIKHLTIHSLTKKVISYSVVVVK